MAAQDVLEYPKQHRRGVSASDGAGHSHVSGAQYGPHKTMPMTMTMTRTGLSVDASGRGAPPKQQKRMGREVLAPGARAFLQEGAIPLEGGLVRGRVRHAAEELKTELPELLEALQQGSAPCTESCESLAEKPHTVYRKLRRRTCC